MLKANQLSSLYLTTTWNWWTRRLQLHIYKQLAAFFTVGHNVVSLLSAKHHNANNNTSSVFFLCTFMVWLVTSTTKSTIKKMPPLVVMQNFSNKGGTQLNNRHWSIVKTKIASWWLESKVVLTQNNSSNKKILFTVYLSRCHKTLVGSRQSNQKVLLLSAMFAQSGAFLWPYSQQKYQTTQLTY